MRIALGMFRALPALRGVRAALRLGVAFGLVGSLASPAAAQVVQPGFGAGVGTGFGGVGAGVGGLGAGGLQQGVQPAGGIPGLGITIDNIIDSPELFLGETVVVSGRITQIVGRRAFTIQDRDPFFQDPLLVLVTDQLPLAQGTQGANRAQGGSFLQGQLVTVAGPVVRFNQQQLGQALGQFGLNLARGTFAGFDGTPAVVAQLVRLAAFQCVEPLPGTDLSLEQGVAGAGGRAGQGLGTAGIQPGAVQPRRFQPGLVPQAGLGSQPRGLQQGGAQQGRGAQPSAIPGDFGGPPFPQQGFGPGQPPRLGAGAPEQGLRPGVPGLPRVQQQPGIPQPRAARQPGIQQPGFVGQPGGIQAGGAPSAVVGNRLFQAGLLDEPPATVDALLESPQFYQGQVVIVSGVADFQNVGANVGGLLGGAGVLGAAQGRAFVLHGGDPSFEDDLLVLPVTPLPRLQPGFAALAGENYLDREPVQVAGQVQLLGGRPVVVAAIVDPVGFMDAPCFEPGVGTGVGQQPQVEITPGVEPRLGSSFVPPAPGAGGFGAGGF